MIIDRANWIRFFEGFTVTDCAIRSKDMYMFVLVKQSEDDNEDTLWQTRFLMVYADEPVAERFYCSEYGNLETTSLTFNNSNNRWEFVAVDMDGQVYSHDDDQDSMESNIPNDLPKSNFISPFVKVVRSADEIFAVAWDRRLFRRSGKTWIEVTQQQGGIPYDKKSLNGKAELSLGFNDASAFSLNDMYAVGGAGDVWHFNGKKWQQVHFPTNELLNTVCCAGDGNVYITGNNGSLWVGREDKWKRLVKGELSLAFKDSAWFAGRLYCGNDYGLWVLKDGKLKSFQDEVDSVVATSCGRIDISPDGAAMLSAGPHGATLFDGKKWEVLFNAFQLP